MSDEGKLEGLEQWYGRPEVIILSLNIDFFDILCPKETSESFRVSFVSCVLSSDVLLYTSETVDIDSFVICVGLRIGQIVYVGIISGSKESKVMSYFVQVERLFVLFFFSFLLEDSLIR